MPDRSLNRLTPEPTSRARISLGAAGQAIAVREHLRFQLDHALARDAVHTALDTGLLTRGLREHGLAPILLQSQAADRAMYLRRPDLGRTLHPDSIAALQTTTTPSAPQPALSLSKGLDSETWEEPAQSPRILFLLADGLSALALERHALPLLDATLPLLPTPYSLLPVVTNARVAIADHIGQLLHAQVTVLLIGERPGLSSPDSLGCYITWNPRPGRTTDAERNCISNIRGTEGLSYAEAAHRIAHYITEAQRLKVSGIALKDPEPAKIYGTSRQPISLPK